MSIAKTTSQSLDSSLSAAPLGSHDGDDGTTRQPSRQGAAGNKRKPRRQRDPRSYESGGGYSSLGFTPDSY
jgi:hypothetical protein